MTPLDHSFSPDSLGGIDQFNRVGFARRIAQSACLPPDSPSVTIAIEGAWGSGKSYVLDRMRAGLEEADPKPVVVQLAPWLLSGADSMMVGLVQEIALAVGAEDGKSTAKGYLAAAKTILGYAAMLERGHALKYVPGLSGIGVFAEEAGAIAKQAKVSVEQLEAATSSMLSAGSLADQKARVRDALRSLGRPLVVFLDDLDRLTEHEMREVFQFIKSVADFPGVCFVIAYDPEQVAKSMFGKDNVEDGYAYLEKIVQVSYGLPRAFNWQLANFLGLSVSKTFADLGIQLFPFEERLAERATAIAAQLLSTPRDVIRLCNRLRISLPQTNGAVNVYDSLVYEALSLRCREVVGAIVAHPEYFLGRDLFDDSKNDEEDWAEYFNMSADTRANHWRTTLPADADRALVVTKALHFLFPFTRGATGDKDAVAELRICVRDHFIRHIALAKLGGMLDGKEAHAMLADSVQFAKALGQAGNESTALLLTLSQYLPTAGDIPRGELICAIALASWDDIGPDEERGVATSSAEFLRALVMTAPAQDRSKLCQLVVEKCLVSVSHDTVLAVAQEHHLWIEEPDSSHLREQIVSEVSIAREIIHEWLKKLSSLPDDQLAAEPRLAAVLYRWGQLTDSWDGVRAAVTRMQTLPVAMNKIASAVARDWNFNIHQLDILPDRDSFLPALQLIADTENARKLDELLNEEGVKNYFNAR